MTDATGDAFAPIHQARVADEVVRRIEQLILEGILRDGDRLPGERDLALRLDVSRPVLREALKVLEGRGLLVSRHGGGTSVADVIGEIFSPPMRALISRHHRATQDYLDYRREIEGLAAALAAERATEADRGNLSRIVGNMRAALAANDRDRGLAADVAFHTAVGESAHNVILLHTLRSCYRLLSDDIFFSRTTIFSAEGAAERLLAQHEAIFEAILSRDAAAARQAAAAHIDFVIDATREGARSDERERISQMRLVRRPAS